MTQRILDPTVATIEIARDIYDAHYDGCPYRTVRPRRATSTGEVFDCVRVVAWAVEARACGLDPRVLVLLPEAERDEMIKAARAELALRAAEDGVA